MKPVTVITGGAGGMGFAAANIFGHQGHTLLLCDVKEEALQSAAVSLKRQNMDVHYLVTDVVEWIEMSGAEYLDFVRDPENKDRFFLNMKNDVLECSKEEYLQRRGLSAGRSDCVLSRK